MCFFVCERKVVVLVCFFYDMVELYDIMVNNMMVF